MPTKHRPQWYTAFVFNQLTCQWEKIAEIKSPGLVNLFLLTLHKVYGQEAVRIVEGKTNTLPAIHQHPWPAPAEMEIRNK